MNLAAYLLTLILPDINQQQAFAGLSAVTLTIKTFMIMLPVTLKQSIPRLKEADL